MAAPVAAKVAIKVAQSKTGRRVIAGALALVFGIVMVPIFVIGGMVTTVMGGNTDGTCEAPGDVEGYSDEQLAIAQTIVSVGKELKVSESGIQISLMVALVESNLKNLANSNVPESLKSPNQGIGSDHDSVNPFQQRPAAGWGTVAELMQPRYAARAFFGGTDGPNNGSPRGLLDVPGWEEMPLGVAAQTVQVSAFPDRYAEREGAAKRILASLGEGGSDCTDDDGGPQPKVVGGWANPVGMQPWVTRPSHAGGAMDVAVGVGTPIYAPAAGRVWDLSEGCGGRVLGIQHDLQYTTVFAHLSQFVVATGTQVKAGQLIGYSGATGACVDGAHLHFEVRVGPNPNNWGNFTPAYRFMRTVGITMGPCTGGCDIYPM